jgi:carboxymethylenebutenolidase
MKRQIASDYHPEVLRLFDKYVHGALSRRDFIDRAKPFTAGASAAAVLSSLSPNYSWAQQVPEGDSRIRTQRVNYDSAQGHGSIRAYVARPASVQGKLPGVVVVHENRGLNPYIEDVARRLGLAGYLAFAPDGLTPKGGYPGNDGDGRRLQAELDRNKLVRDFAAAVEHLQDHPDCTGKVGVVGFCFGGFVVNALAVQIPDLSAGVSFYGRQPPARAVARISAPLLLHYAELDQRINQGWPDFEAALKGNGKTYLAHMYPSVNHGFHNDTTPRFDEEAAKLAWERSLEFFAEHLR